MERELPSSRLKKKKCFACSVGEDKMAYINKIRTLLFDSALY